MKIPMIRFLKTLGQVLIVILAYFTAMALGTIISAIFCRGVEF